MRNKFVVWMSEVDKEDVVLVGGKGANLGEMAKIGIPVPLAFIVTSAAYFHFLDQGKLRPEIKTFLEELELQDPEKLQRTSESIRKLILKTPIPHEIAKEIIQTYSLLDHYDTCYHGEKKGLVKRIESRIRKIKGALSQPLVAIRSSATAEDLPTASFAGQQETFLNVKGEACLIEKVRACWASLFTPRAIFYREEQKFDHFKVGIAVPVQRMVQSETSGVMFTIDPVTHEKKKIIIEAVLGLGELVVQGQQIPDRYEVEKGTLAILKKEISVQDKMLVRKGRENRQVDVPKGLKNKQKVSDEKIIELSSLGKKIERHYFFPQDIEWAIEKGKVYIVQTRPVTTLRQAQGKLGEEKKKPEVPALRLHSLNPIMSGIAASPGIATGSVKIIHSAKEINRVATGDILVAEMTNPDFVLAMKRAVAIVTDKGGRTAHAAIVSRELGIPCIVGTKIASKLLKTGQVITVNGTTGEVFRGGLLKRTEKEVGRETFEASKPTPSSVNLKTATKVYVNLADPERAKEVSLLPVDGVGLLRAEFMIAQIGVHPKKIIKDRKQKVFVDKLSSSISVFCEAFNPRPVVYRTTDLKTNEYRNLTGGKFFEPNEENPLLGYRGACRYLVDQAVFELEIEALKRVRNKEGFRNLWLMLPFVRTPKELLEVKKIIASNGLIRSPSFKLWLMVETPANVILLDKFIEVGIDGVSIGSNDLTMLILGVDRDNSEVAHIFNEQDESVLWALEQIVKTCQKRKITSSICGQAPSDYPDLVEKLVEWGITSVSVNPDAVIRTRETIYEAEKKLVVMK